MEEDRREESPSSGKLMFVVNIAKRTHFRGLLVSYDSNRASAHFKSNFKPVGRARNASTI